MVRSEPHPFQKPSSCLATTHRLHLVFLTHHSNTCSIDFLLFFGGSPCVCAQASPEAPLVRSRWCPYRPRSPRLVVSRSRTRSSGYKRPFRFCIRNKNPSNATSCNSRPNVSRSQWGRGLLACVRGRCCLGEQVCFVVPGVYGDTDSVFIKFNTAGADGSEPIAQAFGWAQELEKLINTTEPRTFPCGRVVRGM